MAPFGNDILVGAGMVDIDKNGDGVIDPAIDAVNAGAVYLFDGITGAIKLTLTLGSQARTDDLFGFSVSAVGKDILVGARGVDIDTNGDGIFDVSDAGAAYLFDGMTGALKYTLTSSSGRQPMATDFFGFSVSAVGNDVLVGAPYVDIDTNGDGRPDVTNAGAAFLFEGATGALKLMFTLGSQARASDNFGYSVASVSNDVLVGAYSVDL